MNLTVSKLPESKARLVAVASELIPDDEPSKIETITHGENMWKVREYYYVGNEVEFALYFMYGAFCEVISTQDFYKKFSKSHGTMFFLCEPIEKPREKEQPKQSEFELFD